MRVIFVPVADRPECAKALRTAFEIGGQLGANVLGCHIRAHTSSEVAFPSGNGALGDDRGASELVWSGKKTKKGGYAAKALFGKVAVDQGYDVIKKPRSTPGAVWLEKVGSPDKVLSIMGPVSDLVVVSRPLAKGGTLANAFMLSALMCSSRPVLILPQSGKRTLGRRISIAWNQSAEAARAVDAAMPLLQQAEQVNIISCGPEDAVGPKSAQLATYLRFWGIKPEQITVREDHDAKAIIKGCKEARSDLLVMGAYSRSRLRQRIFGGVTEFMLHKASIPVFMLHT
jgi:nucleotide-binding universal stress UspA family protein